MTAFFLHDNGSMVVKIESRNYRSDLFQRKMCWVRGKLSPTLSVSANCKKLDALIIVDHTFPGLGPEGLDWEEVDDNARKKR